MPEGTERAPSAIRLYSLIGLMTAFWSFNYIVAKFVLREFPPLLASGIRTALAGVLMLPIYAYYNSKGQAGWDRSDVKKLLGLGMCGVALNQVLFVAGISQTSVAHAAIMIALTPVLVLLLARLGGQEHLSLPKLGGMAVAIAGVLVLQFASRSDRQSSLVGDLLVIGASLTFAIFSVMSKRQAGKLPGVVLNTFAYVASGIAMLPIVAWQSRGFDFGHVSPTAWSGIFYMAAFSSVLCYVIYYYALAYVPASRVAAFSYLQPVMATIMAIPLLGERPTSALLLGGSLVLLGVFLAERA